MPNPDEYLAPTIPTDATDIYAYEFDHSGIVYVSLIERGARRISIKRAGGAENIELQSRRLKNQFQISPH